ncbi:MAG TPA: hypothetical protein V6D48_15205, partial [Oculatellaceae cyanobacterium]
GSEERASAFADKNSDFIDKSGRKCFAPTAKNRLLQEVNWLKTQLENHSVSALHSIVVETMIRPTQPRIQDA